jgi:uncharacterized protein YndB with AHSA1/START domain
MPGPNSITQTFTINAPAADVWKALTDPEMIRQYFFGTTAISDWKKGSKLFFTGEWEGKPYEDKGYILDIETNKLLRYTYWSSFSGTTDSPENYANITYELESNGKQTALTIIQDGLDSQEKADHSTANWKGVIDGLKKLVEK